MGYLQDAHSSMLPSGNAQHNDVPQRVTLPLSSIHSSVIDPPAAITRDSSTAKPPRYESVQIVDEDDGSRRNSYDSYLDTTAAASVHLRNQQDNMPTPIRRRESSFLNDIVEFPWLSELICVVFSLGCIFAVVALASSLDNTRLSAWTFFLQPSTLISILVTGAQSSMLFVVSQVISQSKWLQFWTRERPLNELAVFDSASRGPLGAARLFWPGQAGSGLRHLLAYGGSLVTILALTTGPFAQQIVRIRLDQVPRDDVNSSIAVSSAYDSGIEGNFQTLNPLDINVAMQGAFTSSLYLPQSPFDLVCSSGNCSWPDFATLGFCSTCVDKSASTRVLYTVTNLTEGGIMNDTYLSTDDGVWEFHHMLFSQKDTNSTYNSYVEVQGLSDLTNMDNTTGYWQPAKGVPDAHLVRFAIAQQSKEGQLKNWAVTECSIDWCVKAYSNVTMCDGALDLETYLVREIPLQPQPSTSEAWGRENRSLSGNDGSFNWYFIPAAANGSASQHSNGSAHPAQFGNTSVFTVNALDHTAIVSYLTQMFFIFYANNGDLFSIGAALQYGTDISSTIASVAKSMTIAVSTGRNATQAVGTVWQQETIIEIYWALSVLPILLVLVSALLLVATSVITYRSRAPLWKSSIIPLVYHASGVQESRDEHKRGDVNVDMGVLENKNSMENWSKSMAARLWKVDPNGQPLFTTRTR